MNDASCDGNSVTLINLRVSEERLLDTGTRGAPCSAFWKSAVFVSKLHPRIHHVFGLRTASSVFKRNLMAHSIRLDLGGWILKYK